MVYYPLLSPLERTHPIPQNLGAQVRATAKHGFSLVSTVRSQMIPEITWGGVASARVSVRKLNLSNTENGDLKIQHFCGLFSLAFGEVF